MWHTSVSYEPELGSDKEGEASTPNQRRMEAFSVLIILDEATLRQISREIQIREIEESAQMTAYLVS